MKTTIKDCLTTVGIQPSAFAFFLMEYAKKKPSKKSKLSGLLTAQLQAQAELIQYHLK